MIMQNQLGRNDDFKRAISHRNEPSAYRDEPRAQSAMSTVDSLTNNNLKAHATLIAMLTNRLENVEKLCDSQEKKQTDLIQMCGLFQSFVEQYGIEAHGIHTKTKSMQESFTDIQTRMRRLE